MGNLDRSRNESAAVGSWKDYYEHRALTFSDPLIINGYEMADGVLAGNVVESMTDYVIKKLRPAATESFLDIGCGCGAMISNLKAKGVIGRDCWGVDIAPSMIIKARQFLPDVKFELFKMTEVDKLNRKFDKIILWGVLYYLDDYLEVEKTVAAIKEILKPGGKALLGWLPDLAFKENYIAWRKTLPAVNKFAAERKNTLECLWLEKDFFLKLPDKYLMKVAILDHPQIPLQISRFFFSVLLEN